jgi:hypothetical protein
MPKFITCTTCNTYLPFTEFYEPNRKKCKACRRSEVKAFYNRHKAAVLARQRQARASDDYRAARRASYQRKQVCH